MRALLIPRETRQRSLGTAAASHPGRPRRIPNSGARHLAKFNSERDISGTGLLPCGGQCSWGSSIAPGFETRRLACPCVARGQARCGVAAYRQGGEGHDWIVEHGSFGLDKPGGGSGYTGCRKPQAASRKPQAASRKPQAASRKPQAASRKPQAASRKPQAASRKPQAASRKPQAASRKPQAASRKPQALSLRAHYEGACRMAALAEPSGLPA